jgi:hypothetical protein
MTPDEQERAVWDLLVQNFNWEVPPGHPVTIRTASGKLLTTGRVQIFELMVTEILAQMRPEFAWSVTPNSADSGIDFMGVQRFLDDSELGINAAITVGGQCKKRTTVNEVVNEIAGSLIQMADAINPTLIVVALSARLSRSRVERARKKLQRQTLRQCHILERTQIEGLMVEHLEVVTEILRQGLSESDREAVLEYLKARSLPTPPPSVSVNPPMRILAGRPFRVHVDVHWSLASHPDARLWWRSDATDPDAGALTLIGPMGADGAGARLLPNLASETPFMAAQVLEFTTYTVGRLSLGEVVVGLERADDEQIYPVNLGEIDVVENMRPRFFEPPYRAVLARLGEAYDRASAGAPGAVHVLGVGGSGKSRCCEEFALEKRRRGGNVIAVRHPKTHEEPLRVLADLFSALAGDLSMGADPAEGVLQAVSQYDAALAERATTGIRSLFGTRTSDAVDVKEQHVVSALLLLLVARSRHAPLIVHLQDLHWCSVDVLAMLERLTRQLTVLSSSPSGTGVGAQVLFVFEGRTRETTDSADVRWSSAPFEAFVLRHEGSTVTCSAFSAEDGLSFARRLFENRHNAHRMLAADLQQLQDDLIERICRSAGGNPFHTLEQVRLLKETGVIGQNPRTGLLYLMRAEPAESVLPESVFAAIKLRWDYLRARAEGLALLVWASALLDDRIHDQLFRSLWRTLAPDQSLRDIDATDILWTGDGNAGEVAFRHENYFEAIRRFTVSEQDRRRVVEAYCDWFGGLRRPTASERFGWARSLLELPDPDRTRARELLVSALRSSRRSGDPRLTRRILTFYLDLIWDSDDRAPLASATFLRHCDEERELCRDLLTLDREQATQRIGHMLRRIERHVAIARDHSPGRSHDRLLLRLFAAQALHAQLLFNDRRPAEAADIAERVIAGVRTYRARLPEDDGWEWLEMETLYTQSVAQAISGEFTAAVRSSEAAAEIAERSTSPRARMVVSTYGTIVSSEDPEKGVALLRQCLEQWPDDGSSDACLVHIHLGAALAHVAYRLPSDADRRRRLLQEACDRTSRVYDVCRRLGFHPDVGAAALVRGVVGALLGDDDNEASWFAQAVAAAARGRQMETLWRSHINLALALRRKEQGVSSAACDHAIAALEIMEDTLTVYAEPERSPRFSMLRPGLAQATSTLLAAQDDRGFTMLERYPSLRGEFADPVAGELVRYDGGPRYYQWLQVGDLAYVVY